MADTKFIPLHDPLQNWFTRDLADLPQQLQARVKKEYSPVGWERLTAESREQFAKQVDYQNDPGNEID